MNENNINDLLGILAVLKTTSNSFLQATKKQGFPLPQKELKALETVLNGINN